MFNHFFKLEKSVIVNQNPSEILQETKTRINFQKVILERVH